MITLVKQNLPKAMDISFSFFFDILGTMLRHFLTKLIINTFNGHGLTFSIHVRDQPSDLRVDSFIPLIHSKITKGNSDPDLL